MGVEDHLGEEEEEDQEEVSRKRKDSINNLDKKYLFPYKKFSLGCMVDNLGLGWIHLVIVSFVATYFANNTRLVEVSTTSSTKYIFVPIFIFIFSC